MFRRNSIQYFITLRLSIHWEKRRTVLPEDSETQVGRSNWIYKCKRQKQSNLDSRYNYLEMNKLFQRTPFQILLRKVNHATSFLNGRIITDSEVE